MRLYFLMLIVVVVDLRTSAVPVELNKSFNCTKKGWTFEPTNCFINSHEWQGELSVASDGSQCQQWSDVAEEFDDDAFPDGSKTAAGNNCRDPSNKLFPWCYTTNSETTWARCDVPQCSGDTYFEEDDPCLAQCQCIYTSENEVQVVCPVMACPMCYGKLIKDGSCCGFCDMTVCELDGNDYKNGEQLPSEDPCLTCHCVADGTNPPSLACVAPMCMPCSGVLEDDGSCCGKCNEGCLVNGTLHAPDEEFEDGCSHCRCTVSEEGPNVECFGTPCAINCHESMMIMEEGACCPTCRPGCYDKVTLQVYEKDEEIPRTSNCEMCHCHEDSDGYYHTLCTVENCLPCEGPVEEDGSCCGICHMPGCLVDGTLYDHDDKVPSEDPCLHCVCVANGDKSELMCATMDCFCPGQVIPDGTCCGSCEPGCFDDKTGKFYPEGAEVYDRDPCVTKTCRGGEIISLMMACAVCPGIFVPDGSCCGGCTPGCYHKGKHYAEGQEIPMRDPCTSAFCEDGQPVIVMMGCPACPGLHIDDETCCGQCISTTPKPTTLGGPVPPSTTTEPVCDPSKCPKLPCSKSLRFQPKDSCCQQCKCKVKVKGGKKGQKKIYMPDDVVGDECDGCVCNGDTGKVSCTPPACPKIDCVDPVRGDDCCYHCQNGKTCLVQGKKPVTIKYGEYLRVKKSVCTCAGDPWYPLAFCADSPLKRKSFADIKQYFPDYIQELGNK